MRVGILIFTIVASLWTKVYGQDENINSKFGLGFGLTQHQNDFGGGINMVTPYFAHQKVAVRLKGNLMWNQHLLDTMTIWTPYSNVSVGITGVAGEVNGFLRLYGEGGTIILFPSNKFSSKSFLVGGYGLFGFEFFMDDHRNYYIEIGGVGTGAIADKVITKPVYSNGLLINVGMRYQF